MKYLAISSLLALLIGAPIALAQDSCCPSDDGSADKGVKAMSAKAAEACATKLATARKDLSSWRSAYNKLSVIERDSLKAAHKNLVAKDPAHKALAPTFGAQADLLAAFAALERAGSDKPSTSAKTADEMSATYRAMARALAGRDSYPVPSLATADEIKAALNKAKADSVQAKKLWDAANSAELSKEDKDSVAAARKLCKQASPRMRAIALNSNAAAKGLDCLGGGEATADSDPRPALVKTTKELQALAAPYLKGVNLATPKPMAPVCDAPSG